MRVLGIIPARGGSKGVKDKNIREVAGQPLISYSIESAKESQNLTEFVVSTDSPDIAKIANTWHAQVIDRPAHMAMDQTPIVPVIQHVLDQFREDGVEFDIVILLQPTSPIRTGADIDRVIAMFQDQGTDAVVSVVPMQDVHPARMYLKDDAHELVPLEPDFETSRRQDIKPVYYRNGAIYAIRVTAFEQHQALIIPHKKAYVMSLDQLLNIDDDRDLAIAQIMVKMWKHGEL